MTRCVRVNVGIPHRQIRRTHVHDAHDRHRDPVRQCGPVSRRGRGPAAARSTRTAATRPTAAMRDLLPELRADAAEAIAEAGDDRG